MKTNGTATIAEKGTQVGVTNPDGTFTPSDDVSDPRWIGRGMLLDEGPMVQVEAGGWQTQYDADARMFVPRGTIARFAIVEGDVLSFAYDNGDVIGAEVKKAVRYKDCLYLRRA